MNERVYRLGRGPWHRKHVRFRVSWIVQVSNMKQQRGAVSEEEEGARVHGIFPLSMGIEREGGKM